MQCPQCGNKMLTLSIVDDAIACDACSSLFNFAEKTPNFIPKGSVESEGIRKESFDYWNGGIPGTVEGGYQSGRVSKQSLSKEWFLQGDTVRYEQYPNLQLFADFENFRGCRVLDIGPGRGQDAHNYIRAGAKVSILEYASQGVDIVRERLRVFGLASCLIQGDVTAIPYRDQTFDLVYSYGVLHHVPDIEKAISEVYRVLKPGGTAKIMVYHKGYFYYKDMFLKWFILKGNFFKYSWPEYIKIAMEQRAGPCPVVQIYSMKEIRSLFSKFEFVSYFNAEVVCGRLIRWGIIPKLLQKVMRNRFGAFAHLTLRRPVIWV